MIRALLPPRVEPRDIAGRASERGDGRRKEIRKWPVKVFECARTGTWLAASVSERGAAHTSGLPSLPPRRSSSTFTCRHASYSRSPGSIRRRATFVLSLCPLTFESGRRGGEWVRPEKRLRRLRSQWRTCSDRSDFPCLLPLSTELFRRASKARLTHVRAIRLYGVSFARRAAGNNALSLIL